MDIPDWIQAVINTLFEKGHWPLAVGIVLVFLLSFIVHNKELIPDLWRRAWVRHSYASIVIIVLALYGLQYAIKTPTPLPKDRLVVALVPYTPVTNHSAKDGLKIRDRIKDQLQLKMPSTQLAIKEVMEGPIIGVDRNTRLKHAQKLAETVGGAHILIWGEVRRDEGELKLASYIEILKPFGLKSVGTHFLGVSFETSVPEFLTFKQTHSRQIAELVQQVYALTWYEKNDLERTAQAMKRLEDPESKFLYGFSLFQLSKNSNNPTEMLNKSINAFREGLQSPSLSTHTKRRLTDGVLLGTMELLDIFKGEVVELPIKKWKAIVTLYDELINESQMNTNRYELAKIMMHRSVAAFKLGSLITSGTKKELLFRTALEGFDQALNYCQCDLSNSLGLSTNLNKGIVVSNLAKVKYDTMRNKDALRRDRQLLTELTESMPWLNKVNTQHGGLQQYANILATEVEKLTEETIVLLKQADMIFDRLLKNNAIRSYPSFLASTHYNRLYTLDFLAALGDTEAEDTYWTDYTRYFEELYSILKKGEYPRQWAIIKEAEGAWKHKQAVRSPVKKRENLYKQALGLFSEAQEIFKVSILPVQWAAVELKKARTFRELGTPVKVAGAAGSGDLNCDYLTMSDESYKKALTVYTKNEFPSFWNTIVNAQMHTQGLFTMFCTNF